MIHHYQRNFNINITEIKPFWNFSIFLFWSAISSVVSTWLLVFYFSLVYYTVNMLLAPPQVPYLFCGDILDLDDVTLVSLSASLNLQLFLRFFAGVFLNSFKSVVWWHFSCAKKISGRIYGFLHFFWQSIKINNPWQRFDLWVQLNISTYTYNIHN